MRKSLLFVGACALAFQTSVMAQGVDDSVGIDPSQLSETQQQVLKNNYQKAQDVVALAREGLENAKANGAEPMAMVEEETPVAEQAVATEVAPAPVAEPAPLAEMPAQVNTLPIAQMLAKARQEGKIKADGSFSVDEDGLKANGKILCADAELEQNLKVLSDAAQNPNFNEDQVQRVLNQTLKCVSVSDVEYTDKDGSFKFEGQFDYPTFKDGSSFKVRMQGQDIVVGTFNLDGVQQTFDGRVFSNKGEKLGVLKTQYNTDKIGEMLEMTTLVGLLGYANKNGGNAANQMVEQRIMSMVSKRMANLYDAAHLLQFDIYRDHEKPLLQVRGDVQDNFDAKLFNAAGRDFITSSWDGMNSNLKIDFPKTDMPFVKVAGKAPADFREKYKNFVLKMMSMSQTPNAEPPVAELGYILSGVETNVVLYGMNKAPLAELNVKTNDSIQLSIENQPKVEDIVQNAELKLMKNDATCPIKTITFSKDKPMVLTVCGNDGCHDENKDTIAQSTVPGALVSCLAEVPMMAQQYKQEAIEEFKELQSSTAILAGLGMMGAGAGMAGVGAASAGGVAGYNMAMARADANELMSQAAMVAVTAMSKNGGEGGNADLSELGELSEEMKKLVAAPTDISATKEGVVTIRVKPEVAKDVLPLVGQISAKKVVSGCTAADTTCVLDMTK